MKISKQGIKMLFIVTLIVQFTNSAKCRQKKRESKFKEDILLNIIKINYH